MILQNQSAMLLSRAKSVRYLTLNVSPHGPSPETVARVRDIVADHSVVEESRADELVPKQSRLVLGG